MRGGGTLLVLLSLAGCVNEVVGLRVGEGEACTFWITATKPLVLTLDDVRGCADPIEILIVEAP